MRHWLEPESSKTLSKRLLLAAPMELAMQIVAGHSLLVSLFDFFWVRCVSFNSKWFTLYSIAFPADTRWLLWLVLLFSSSVDVGEVLLLNSIVSSISIAHSLSKLLSVDANTKSSIGMLPNRSSSAGAKLHLRLRFLSFQSLRQLNLVPHKEQLFPKVFKSASLSKFLWLELDYLSNKITGTIRHSELEPSSVLFIPRLSKDSGSGWVASMTAHMTLSGTDYRTSNPDESRTYTNGIYVIITPSRT